MIQSDYQGQDERQKGSSRFVGQLDDPEAAILVITLRSQWLRLFLLVQVLV